MRRCIGCGGEKPLTEFRYRADRRAYMTRCRPCERTKQLENYYSSKARDLVTWRFRVMRNNRSKHITLEWLHATLESQGGRCALSGREIDLTNCEIDHIIPETRGGSDELSNLRLVCTRANEAKGNMTDTEFLALCHDVLAKREIIGRAILAAQSEQQARAA